MVDAGPDIELHVVIARSPERVWLALTDDTAIREWWAPGVLLDPEVGGAFVEPWVDSTGRRLVTSGEVVESIPGVRLALTWADHGWPYVTYVEITLAQHRDGCFVRLRHSGWEQWDDPDERAALVRTHRDGWEHHLASLTLYCEQRF